MRWSGGRRACAGPEKEQEDEGEQARWGHVFLPAQFPDWRQYGRNKKLAGWDWVKPAFGSGRVSSSHHFTSTLRKNNALWLLQD